MTMEEKNWRNFAAYIIENGRRHESRRSFAKFINSEIGEVCMALAGLPIDEAMKKKLIDKNENTRERQERKKKDFISYFSLENVVRNRMGTFNRNIMNEALRTVAPGLNPYSNRSRSTIISKETAAMLLKSYEKIASKRPHEKPGMSVLWILSRKRFSLKELCDAMEIPMSKAKNRVVAFRHRYGSDSLELDRSLGNDRGTYIVRHDLINKEKRDGKKEHDD